MLDWKALSPHRPLDASDPRYALRPDGGGDRLAQLISAGASSIAVAGPVGCGKSTEVARAAGLLGEKFETHLIQLDRKLDMRQVTEGQVLAEIGWALASERNQLLLRDRILDSLRSRQNKEVVLFIDGLEKTPAAVAQGIALSVLGLAEEARVVLVVPPSLVIGPAAYEIVHGTRIVALRALPYWGWGKYEGWAAKAAVVMVRQHINEMPDIPWPLPKELDFLLSIFRLRLGLPRIPSELNDALFLALVLSGGLPRVFLQLLQDASTYAALAGREAPTRQDLKMAADDQADSLALLLQAGDAHALAQAFGTNGLEVSLDRKLRFFTHGLLLEYEEGTDKVVFPSPLLWKFFLKYLQDDLAGLMSGPIQ